jgi:hypothetical protein
MHTSIYRLTPAAGDPRGKGERTLGDVFVRAGSPVDARLVAAEAEQQYRMSSQFASRFLDEKFYRVCEAKNSPHARRGPRAVLCGDITAKVLKSRLAAMQS